MTLDELKDRFRARNDKGCWLRPGTDSSAEVSVPFEGSRQAAHRVSLKLHGQNVPDGWSVKQQCKTRGCVNPEHLHIQLPFSERKTRSKPATDPLRWALPLPDTRHPFEAMAFPATAPQDIRSTDKGSVWIAMAFPANRRGQTTQD